VADIEVTESSRRLTVREGDRIIVRLRENPSTGYQWQLQSVSEALELESSDFDAQDSRLAGGGGQRVVVLRAAHPGCGEAELALARSWQPSQPAERWRVEVVVTGRTAPGP
jgi:inhibitor of cysteine peptidase